jgi:NADH-quinone oxidoreductase subunit A
VDFLGVTALRPMATLAAVDRVVDYLPIFILLLFAISFAAVNLVLSWLAGVKAKGNPAKDAGYECGLPAITDPHARFSVKFYLVALLFVLFDIEVVFLFPWAAYFQTPGRQLFLLAEMLVFAGILFFGWWYVMRKGAVDWSADDSAKGAE